MRSEIRANTVLPADRRPVTLQTADGLSLVGELSLPVGRPPVATVVCLHPLPTHGGMMDSHLIRKASYRLPALAGIAVLRFNTRGTSSAQGTSQGSFDQGDAERYDVAAAVERAEVDDLPEVWLVGWSFGTDLVLRYGLERSVAGAVLLSPSLRFSTEADLDAWAADGRPLVALVPEHDDYVRPDEARSRFARVPQAEVVAVPGAKHLWVGHAERVLDEVVARVAPEASPLPHTWSGPLETADSSMYADRTTAVFGTDPTAAGSPPGAARGTVGQ
jgi:alpha/beta superfamily hydrolase